jgi:hypothetical protein
VSRCGVTHSRGTSLQQISTLVYYTINKYITVQDISRSVLLYCILREDMRQATGELFDCSTCMRNTANSSSQHEPSHHHTAVMVLSVHKCNNGIYSYNSVLIFFNFVDFVVRHFSQRPDIQ